MNDDERDIILKAVFGKTPNTRRSGSVILSHALVAVAANRAHKQGKGRVCSIYRRHIIAHISDIIATEYGDERIAALLAYLQKASGDKEQEALLTELLANHVPSLLLIPYHSY